MAAAPRSHLHVKKLSLEAGIPAGKENSMTPPEARPFTPPQEVPNASDQASVSAALEWQRKLEAAEALLALKNSSWDPPESISLHQPCSPPAPAGDRGLQPPSPPLRPRPASSVSLPIGHLGCISLLT
ncbi:LOW QUALITY PROTEIN: doublesex- and mab-3-related transcription factor C1 [Sciurus carolinensis]|uniref:Doublesex- and mab-3-related transcription factor C1/C2 C-terminal domain-containing protein n=1 Tax=Sciurus vulgaris TaxID=55149 RepID=A0A8D2D522_SCIVU|nr:LOW QUALITY PROTEIN: doublesex- and mab-3-related transcription factor C1 [Sciurus carolinensis]